MPTWVRRISYSVGVLQAVLAPVPAVGQGLELETQLLASGLNRPLAAVHAGDDSGRLFLVEQSGQILIHDGTTVSAAPFLDLAAKIEIHTALP